MNATERQSKIGGHTLDQLFFMSFAQVCFTVCSFFRLHEIKFLTLDQLYNVETSLLHPSFAFEILYQTPKIQVNA